MKYIVYKTTCLINNKIYIGVHKTENPEIFDGYLGNSVWINKTDKISNPKFPFHFAVKKYGINNFNREVLYVYDTIQEAFNKEAEIVNENFIKSDKTYNVALGGNGGKLSKPVYQFDLNGNLLNTYEGGILNASKSLEVSYSCIHNAIQHKHVSNGFLWSYDIVINLNDFNIIINNKYYIYDSLGNFIQEFETASECIKFLETNSANLSRAVQLQNKIGGYFITTEKVDKLIISISKSSGKLNRYTVEGEYIDSFNTVAEAKEKLGLKLSSISQSIKLNRVCNGFRWTRSDNPELYIEIPKNKNKPRKVQMFDLKGNLIKTFNTVSAADSEFPGCRSVLKGQSKHSHGYIFKYA